MSDLIQRIQRKVYNTKVFDKQLQLCSPEPPENTKIEDHVRYMDVRLIVMSYETLREIMRLDYSGSYLNYPYDKTMPYRLFGIRVVLDDSLKFEEVLVAGEYLV